MMTWGVYGRSRVPHAREAASASARAKRERARACVRKTASGRVWCWCCCCCRCRCRCRVVVVDAAPTSRRRGARAPPPRQMPSAMRRHRARCNGTPLPSTLPTVPVCKSKKQAQKTPRRDLDRRPQHLITCQPDTTARQGSRHFQYEFQVHNATCAQKHEKEVS